MLIIWWTIQGIEAEVSLELKLNKTSRAKYEGTIGSFKRMDKRLIPEPSVRKGFRASGIDHLSKGVSWHDTKPSMRNNLRNRGYRRVRFRSCGTVGYGPTMWVKSRKGADILHGYDSKACQRIVCQLCRQQHWYQERGMKRTIFLLVERGGPIGKVLVHRWLSECHQQ